MKAVFRWLNKFLLGWSVLLYFRPQVRWEEKGSMPKGPVILAANHKNHMDFLLLMAVFYFRYLRCLVGKAGLGCQVRGEQLAGLLQFGGV